MVGQTTPYFFYQSGIVSYNGKAFELWFMDWTNAKILDFKLDFTNRRFIESYFINQIPYTMNDKQNDKFPSIYSATLLQTTWRSIIVFHLRQSVSFSLPICYNFCVNV